MNFVADKLSIYASSEVNPLVISLFSEEWQKRTGFEPIVAENENVAKIVFSVDPTIENNDLFVVNYCSEQIIFTAKTIRGLIFGYSLLLRKTTFIDDKAVLKENISGTHAPQKQIRGHQIGYRTTPNTYDAWDYNDYFRCQLDLMAFGANTIEHNGSRGKGEFRNRLMKYEQEEFLIEASRLAKKVDIDVSLWYANDDKQTEEEALTERDRLFSLMERLDYCFIPGGDPGDMQADDFIQRCKLISKIYKKHHPEGKMHISAQAPHSHPDWGEIFVRELSAEPGEFDAVIMGPNHAYPMHQLREKIPARYPMRFYPDLTHNLRCEYPVNFQQDDWHFAFCNTLSRESVNPRPTELRTLYRIFAPYTIGGVSYSEGVHDDVNKAVWSALEWNKDADLREILLDYARFFIYGVDEEEIADIIFLMEKSWQGDPVENPCIEVVYHKLCTLLSSHPFLEENWRFKLLYFRSCCDMLVKMRRSFELKLCKEAMLHLKEYNVSSALEVLNTPFSEDYNTLRETITKTADKLFKLIGIQLDVEHYCADGWERGAVLDTIDNNVTDKAFLISKLQMVNPDITDEDKYLIDALINRNVTATDEVYYSVALHNLNTLGVTQNGEFYMDVQGDRPSTREAPLPMSMTKVYDHFTFEARFGGFLPDTDYELTVVYKDKTKDSVTEHTICANGKIIYKGPQFGGCKVQELDSVILAPGFTSATYRIGSEIFINGALELCISEPIMGVNICELWLKKVKN